MTDQQTTTPAIWELWIHGLDSLLALQLLGLLAGTLFVIYIYGRTRKAIHANDVPHKRNNKTAASDVRTYSACSSPDCVRCHKYQTIRQGAKVRLNQFDKLMGGSSERLTSALTNDNCFGSSSQQPNVFYVPSLTSKAWWSNKYFAHDTTRLEDCFHEIQEEFMELFKTRLDEGSGWSTNKTSSGCWSTFYFYNQGEKNLKNCEKCPKTVEVINSLPGTMLRCIFGNVLFSVLMPGTEITGHYGPTNIRIRCHLGLKVPSHCTLTVDGVERNWQNGKCLVFDDSFYHSAHHQGDISCDAPRALLMLDFWHPSLTDSEKQAIIYAFGARK